MYPEFMQDIERMNRMFDLPVNKSIQLDKDLATKLYKLHNTLTDEVNELLDITEVLDKPLSKVTADGDFKYPPVTIDHYVALADLLGDMIVYCASEAVKHGIPLGKVLIAIMASQWTKLGPNDEVIKDENGKFLKGENYIPPEEHIKTILQAYNRMAALSFKDTTIMDEDYNDRN